MSTNVYKRRRDDVIKKMNESDEWQKESEERRQKQYEELLRTEIEKEKAEGGLQVRLP